MTPYYVGDSPAEDLVIEPLRNLEAVDLTLFDSATVTLYDGRGIEVPSAGFLAEVTDDAVIVEWPGENIFAAPGLYSLVLLLENAEGRRERMPATYLVVQGDDGWHTVDSARGDWPGAPDSDRQVFIALELAKQEVIAKAEELEAEQRPPINYVQAQIMQARNLWNAAKVDPANGGQGEDSFVIRPFPLDWMIKQVLRPQTGIPVVG